MKNILRCAWVCAWLCAAANGFCPASVSAQQTSASDRNEAAIAYDRGTAAYLSQDYKSSAHWFEHANRLVPAPVSLIGASRSQSKLGHDLKAANLALRIMLSFPRDENAMKFAKPIVRQASKRYLRIDARCNKSCELEIDGALTEQRSFFTPPKDRHVLAATFDSGKRQMKVYGPAGTRRSVRFEAPPRKVVRIGSEKDRNTPVPQWAFWTSAGATVALGALTAWSATDMKKGIGAYEDAAAIARSPGISDAARAEAKRLLNAGQKRERRTVALAVITGSAALGTILIGVFTNFKGNKESAKNKVRPSIGIATTGAFAGLEGRF